MPASDSLIDKQLGDYTIQELLGSGGMARVYRGYDANLDRHAAIKVISGDFSSEEEEEYNRRFLKEARAIARLDHPNIVGVYQFGQDEGVFYMAMKLLDGEDLGVILRRNTNRGQRMPKEDVLKMAYDITAALDHAHKEGVVHRDVKPSNIMITTDEKRAVLMDFGLVLSIPEGTEGYTFGTAHYIAPEQAVSSANAVPQSDLYALGVVLYRIFAGRVPFTDPSAMNVAYQHVSEPPPQPSLFNPDITDQLERVLLHALQKSPDARYQSGADLVTALEGALNVKVFAGPDPSQAVTTPMRPPTRGAGNKKSVQFRLVLGGIALVVILGMVLLSSGVLDGNGDASSSQSPVGRGNNQIAITSASEITLFNIADDTSLPLTRNNFIDNDASWSADGSQIAFRSDRDGGFEIYVMDADGNNVQQLTQNEAGNFRPAWSPDSSQITFHSDRDGDFEIYVMDTDGNNVQQLTQSEQFDGFAMWSPDGSQITFHSDRDGDFEIYVMDSDGTDVRQLTQNATDEVTPAWSPNGSQIAFTSNRDGDFEIYVIDGNGRDMRQLTQNEADEFTPTWSPDGSQIAFTSNRDGNRELYVMEANGESARRLTETEVDEFNPVWRP